MSYQSLPSASPFDTTNAQMDDLLARLNERDRAAVEKHLATCDAEPDETHGRLWRRFAGLLATLAPAAPRRRGTHAMEFLIPDGKYRKQVFALEDRHNGVVVVYLPDVLERAVAAGVLVVAAAGAEAPYCHPGAPADSPVALTVMTAANSPDAPEHVEHMLGWNRKAVRVVLRSHSSDPRDVRTAQALCRLAAAEWGVPPRP